MDGIIQVKVRGSHLSVDTSRGGVQGEANVTSLRITFSEDWMEFEDKRTTFLNALGLNPTEIKLTEELLEEGSDNVYLFTIPGEAYTHSGWFSFVIDGYAEGVRKRSVEGKLECVYAPSTDGEHLPAIYELTEIEVMSGKRDVTHLAKKGVYFGKVIVLGDEDLVPENIKAGVEILGVFGNYRPAEMSLQRKEEVPLYFPWVVNPDPPNDGLIEVKLNTDPYLKPENIKAGITIFSVTGTYRGEGDTPVDPDVPVDPDEPEEPTDPPYGYIYGGYVLPKAEWDEESYPYAYLYVGESFLVMYVAATPFVGDGDKSLEKVAPFGVLKYDFATKTWGEFEVRTSGGTYPPCSRVAWVNHDVINPDGSIVFNGTPAKPFYLNDPDMPTAFLYTTGAMTFQSHSTPSDEIEAAFVKWDTEQYDTNTQVPWLNYYTSSISNITISEDAIPEHTDNWFDRCSNLHRATLPEGMTKIGEHMFRRTAIVPISIPSTVEEIGAYAYASLQDRNDTPLQAIIIPEKCKKIGDGAFSSANFSQATSVSIGAGCEEIGRNAFYDNPKIHWITIGASVKRINPNAFYRCGSNRSGINNYDDQYCSIEFKNTEGWWVSTDANATEGTAVDVTDEATTAKMLAGYSYGDLYSLPTWEDGTYVTYYWNRSESSDEPVVPDEPNGWLNFNDFRGYYNSEDNNGTSTRVDFNAGEFPLTFTENISVAATSNAIQCSSPIHLLLNPVPYKVGDLVELEVRLPNVTFEGLDHPYTKYYFSIIEDTFVSKATYVYLNWDSADAGLVLEHSSYGGAAIDSCEITPINADGQIIGFTLRGTWALEKTGRINISAASGAFTNTKPFNISAVTEYASYDDFRIRKIETEE